MRKVITKAEEETIDFAKNFAKTLKGGEVILLQGNLGAGKSVFVRGLAKGLGIKNRITSPTFVLMKVYEVKKQKVKKFIHVDAYRIKTADLFNVGLDEYLDDESSVVAIEWGDKVEKDFRKMKIDFQVIKIVIENNKRQISM